jgi:hypothetical protein
VAVNGEAVNPRTLRDWLGADAENVLRLQGLSAAEQRQVFGLGGESPAPNATREPAEAETPASQVPVTSEGEVSEVPEVPERPEAPEVPETPGREVGRHGSGSRVNVGGSVKVDSDEIAEEVVAIGGSATVDGEVENDVTAIGGPARINGKVGGAVTSVGSSVYLGPKAVVDGDVVSVGGTVHREPGARVEGGTNQVGIFPFGRHGRRFDSDFGEWPFWGGVSDFFGSVMLFILMSVLVCLVIFVAREPLERVDRQLAAQPWRCAAVGLAGAVFSGPLFLAVTVLLLITVVGCLLFLLYPFLILYFFLLLLLGYTAVCYRLGKVLEWRMGRSFGGPYMTALVGLASIHVWLILGNLLDLLPGPFGSVWVFGLLLVVTAVIVGFGAVILARFGLAPGYWPQRGVPVAASPYVPPPVPPGPYEAPVEPLPLTHPDPEWREPEG